MKRFAALLGIMFIGLVAGCGLLGKEEEAPAAAPPPVAPPQAGPPTAAMPPVAAVPSPGSFVWTEAPAFNMVPVTPASGLANNQPFIVAGAVIEPGTDPGSWRLSVFEKPLDSPTSGILDQQYLAVDLPTAPMMGASWIHPMEYGKGYWQINSPESPGQRTSWNAENAWVIEIGKWDVREYDKAAGGAQAVGTASLKLAVCYKGGGSFANSWVAGTLDNVIVRYNMPPKNEPAAPKSSGAAKSGGAAKAGGSSIPGNIGGGGSIPGNIGGGGNISPEEARRLAEEAAKKAKEEAAKRGIKVLPVQIRPVKPISDKK